MKIAIFDSGIGGLSVLYQALKKLPGEEFLYYADEDNVPYGEKTKEQIIEYSDKAVKFLIENGANAVVIACNTATSAAAPYLRSKYSIPIIGMEPAVKKALDNDPAHRVLVVATPITIKGNKLKVLMDKYDNHHLVDLLQLPKLVRFAEKGEFTSEQVTQYLESKLSQFDLSKYSSLVLGCTHFNLFKEEFRKIIPKDMKFTDGNKGTVNQLIRKLRQTDAKKATSPAITFYYSGREVNDANEFNRISKILEQLDKMYYLE